MLAAAPEPLHDDSNSTAPQPREEQRPLLVRFGESKWSPYTVFTDAEYADMLRQQMLGVDVEISVLDDDIAALRRELEASKAGTAGRTADGDGGGDGASDQLDLARRLRNRHAEDVGSREDKADREQVDMARRLRDRLRRREGEMK